jgi:hypothetical protein
MHGTVLVLLLALAGEKAPVLSYDNSQMLGVWCSSRDGGRTCWAYGETYANGEIDSCGTVPGTDVSFAMLLQAENRGDTRCETVVKTSHPEILPVGERFCARLVSVEPDQYSYVFTDDEKVRTLYRRAITDKWCQPAIDSLR